MSFAEDIIKLRQRVGDAVKRGLVSSDKDLFEASLIQIMNDAEKNRQNCVAQAENLRKQASLFDGQAGAFASVSSIVYNVFNGFVLADERDEAARLAAEKEIEEENLTQKNDLTSTASEESSALTPKKKTIKKK
jgi:hypothetical protein